MAERQGATPPPWRGRSRVRLLADVLGGARQNWDKLRQLASLVAAYFRPRLVRRRLERLRALGHIDAVPTIGQLLVAGRDQMMVGAAEETKIFYRAQGIPWIFHNARRFLSGPATMLDPIGLFAPREAIVHHVLQTFHRHPVYDLVLLRAHDGGPEELARQARQIVEGTHPHQRALTSLIEDGAYHARLPADIAAFEQATRAPARPIPTRAGRRSRADAGDGSVQGRGRVRPLRLAPAGRVRRRAPGLAGGRLRRDASGASFT